MTVGANDFRIRTGDVFTPASMELRPLGAYYCLSDFRTQGVYAGMWSDPRCGAKAIANRSKKITGPYIIFDIHGEQTSLDGSTRYAYALPYKNGQANVKNGTLIRFDTHLVERALANEPLASPLIYSVIKTDLAAINGINFDAMMTRQTVLAAAGELVAARKVDLAARLALTILPTDGERALASRIRELMDARSKKNSQRTRALQTAPRQA